jgi:hypothetical protein
MKVSIIEKETNVKVVSDYENNYVKYYMKTISKMLLENLFTRKIANYSKKPRKEMKWENFSSMISNLLYRKIYGHISEKKKSSCTRDENW